MNRAILPTTDEEREDQIAHDRIILARERWPDMHQMEEPDNDSRWNVIATVVVVWAAILCVVVAWAIVGRM